MSTDLTPRATTAKKKRKVGPLVLVAVVVVAIGALLFKTLGDASLFFKNVDEAVQQRTTLGEKRFRMQGSVVPGTITDGEIAGRGAVFFSVSYNGVVADVASYDNPTELFKDGIPVVLEGRWEAAPPSGAFANGAHDGWYFSSDRILVKHDATYTSKESERLKEAEEGGKVPVAASGASGAVSSGASGAAGAGR